MATDGTIAMPANTRHDSSVSADLPLAAMNTDVTVADAEDQVIPSVQAQELGIKPCSYVIRVHC